MPSLLLLRSDECGYIIVGNPMFSLSTIEKESLILLHLLHQGALNEASRPPNCTTFLSFHRTEFVQSLAFNRSNRRASNSEGQLGTIDVSISQTGAARPFGFSLTVKIHSVIAAVLLATMAGFFSEAFFLLFKGFLTRSQSSSAVRGR